MATEESIFDQLVQNLREAAEFSKRFPLEKRFGHIRQFHSDVTGARYIEFLNICLLDGTFHGIVIERVLQDSVETVRWTHQISFETLYMSHSPSAIFVNIVRNLLAEKSD